MTENDSAVRASPPGSIECVCVWVCVRERERETEMKIHKRECVRQQ